MEHLTLTDVCTSKIALEQLFYGECNSIFDEISKEFTTKFKDQFFAQSDWSGSQFIINLKIKNQEKVSPKFVSIVLKDSGLIDVLYYFTNHKHHMVYQIETLKPPLRVVFNPEIKQSSKNDMPVNELIDEIVDIKDYLSSKIMPVKEEFKEDWLEN